MPHYRTGDEAIYRGRGREYLYYTLADWLRENASEPDAPTFLTSETQRCLLTAERLILDFDGSTKQTVKYAWQQVSAALQHCPWFSIYETVTVICVRKANESARDDQGIQPQRCSYITCTIDEGPQALDIMAAGFTRLISADELVEGSVLCDDFVQQLMKVGRRSSCSLNAQKIKAHDIEEEPILHMALSYKHASRAEEGGTIDEATALQIAQSVRKYLSLTHRKHMRLWIDQISKINLTSETEWAAIGLLPFSSLRVMAIANPDVNYITRPWLFYELLAAMMGQGVFVIRSQITTELNEILHVEELEDEAREVFDKNNIIVGFGHRSGAALNRAMMRLVTDHSLNTDSYLYREEFSLYCNWAISRIAWHSRCSVGWNVPERPVDNTTLVEFVRQLCSSRYGQSVLGCNDPLVCGTQFGPRQREGSICIEEIFNRIPSLLSQGTKLSDHFKVEEGRWRANPNSSSRMFRIANWSEEEKVMYLDVRADRIRLSEPPEQDQCCFQITNESQMMRSLEQRIQGNFGIKVQDSENNLSTRKIRTVQELARRVDARHIAESMHLLDDLTNADQASKAAKVVACSRRLRELVDNNRGSDVVFDTIKILQDLLLKHSEITNEETTEAINRLGRTVSFDHLRDKLDILCWNVARRNNAKQVLEVCGDLSGRLYIKATDLEEERVRRRLFRLAIESINFVPFTFIELDACMGEDDVTALGTVYGAIGTRSVPQVSGNWYSRLPGYGNGRTSARLPVKIITGGYNVGLRRYSCLVTGTRECQHITESRVQPWPEVRDPMHACHIRSTLARFADESECCCEGCEEASPSSDFV